MADEPVEEVKQPQQVIAPFIESAWKNTPTIPEPLKEEKTEPTEVIEEVVDEVKDPAIKEKDEKIKEEERVNTEPEQPEAVPAASPKDIPERPKEDKENIKPATELNDTSAKIANLLKEGKEDEVFSVLQQRHILKNIDKLPAPEVIKLQLQNEFKSYTQDEINDLFEERYPIPEKPEQDEFDSEEKYQAKLDRYNEQLAKREARITRDAKPTKEILAQQLQELVLPDIPTKNPEPQEPTQEELDKLQKQREQVLQATQESIGKLDGYNVIYKDEDVEIPVAYKVSEKEKQTLAPVLDSLNTDLPQFFQQLNWVDKDGNLNIDKAVSDLHLILHKDAVFQDLVNKAGNKSRAEEIKRRKNIDFSTDARKGSLDPSAKEEGDKRVRNFINSY